MVLECYWEPYQTICIWNDLHLQQSTMARSVTACWYHQLEVLSEDLECFLKIWSVFWRFWRYLEAFLKTYRSPMRSPDALIRPLASKFRSSNIPTLRVGTKNKLPSFGTNGRLAKAISRFFRILQNSSEFWRIQKLSEDILMDSEEFCDGISSRIWCLE